MRNTAIGGRKNSFKVYNFIVRSFFADAGRNGTGLKGRKGSTPNGTTNGSFSSMEMINARGYGVSNPPAEDFQPPPQYPGYGTGEFTIACIPKVHKPRFFSVRVSSPCHVGGIHEGSLNDTDLN